MYLPVDFCIVDAISNRPVPGVLVKVFGVDGKGIYGEMSTGDDGKASFLLFGDKRYQARVYKFGVGFRNPVFFDVSADPALCNRFTIPATLSSVSAASDPRFCMCSGVFRTPTGAAAVGLDIHFITKFRPILLEGAGVLTERVTVRTDSTGWVHVPLIRFGKYDVMLEGYEDTTREISVPDAPACNLPDLVFEVVDRVEFESATIEVPLGETITVYPKVYSSIGRLLEEAVRNEVSWRVDNTDAVSLAVQWDSLTLYGLATGSAVLTASRSDSSIVRIPDPPILTGIQIQVS